MDPLAKKLYRLKFDVGDLVKLTFEASGGYTDEALEVVEITTDGLYMVVDSAGRRYRLIEASLELVTDVREIVRFTNARTR